jgi:CubicO group peptidase (beta-lactamase class C family)
MREGGNGAMSNLILRFLTVVGLTVALGVGSYAEEKGTPSDTDMDETGTHLSGRVDTLLAMLPEFVEAAFREAGLPSLSIALVLDREIVYSQAFGFLDLEHRTPATRSTIYPIASITKVFTATMLVKLAEEGVVTLDTAVEAYLPEYLVRSPYKGTQPTTLRQLAAHKSGLPRDANVNFWCDYAALEWLLSGGTTEMQWYASKEEVLASLAQTTLEYPPNSRYSYSNLGMTLLGIALERAVGTSFEDYVMTEILVPLGMHNSGFRSQLPEHAVLPRGYVYTEAGSDPLVAPEWELGSARFSGGLYSTAEDMARFLSLQFQTDEPGGSQIVSADGLRMMHLESLAWGYVWDPVHKGVEHSGGHLGFHAYVRAYPDLKIGVVALTNTNNPVADIHPSEEIARAVIGQIKEALEIKVEFDADRVDPTEYAGLYVLPGAGAELSVDLREDVLHVRLLQQPGFDHPMHPVAGDAFGVGGSPDAWLFFARDDAGVIESVSFADFRFEREHPPSAGSTPD